MNSNFNKAKLGLVVSGLVLLGASWVSLHYPENNRQGAENPKVDKLKLQPGFKAEHLYSISENHEGSWVSMTFDDKGRMIASDQYGGLYRLKIPAVGSGSTKPTVEKLVIAKDTSVGMGYAQGLLYAFNSLYVMVNNRPSKQFPKTSGLYRLQDTDGDDQFDKVTMMRELKGEGEHGPHSIVLSPDKQSLFVVAGNHTDVPQMDAYRLPSNWKEDNLFPLIKDPRGHANDRYAPGGWIAKIDPEGKRWELMGAGFRNEFDVAFNEAGDMFTYDSDMEWDFGLPWYRPTRICHVPSGAEFGWRTGNSKWLPGNPDNLPAIVNIGQGSPTNVMSGMNAKFPQKYRQSVFAFDWSFGIIYSIHLKPKGASYEGEREEFISGTPLPLTDGVIGPDGAMYFLTGGRRLESDLYRVYYGGNDANTSPLTPTLTAEHKLRTSLEKFHEGANPAAIAAAWPNLNHPDRFVRYAARIAVEHQPVAQWQEKALAETDPVRAIQAIVALARQGSADLKSKAIATLLKIDFNKLSEPQKFDVTRAFELIFLRMGAPEAADKAKIVAYLNPHFPAKSALLNRGLSKDLIYLEAPNVVNKTLALMDLKTEPGMKDLDLDPATASNDLILRNPQYGMDIAKMLAKVPPLQQTYYAVMLSREDAGWTPELRDKYFSWFGNAFKFEGGRSYVGFIDRARKLALQHVPKEQFEKYNKMSGADLLTSSGNDIVKSDYTPKGPGRRWTLENAVAAVDTGKIAPDFVTGKKIYAAVLCSSCHAMQGSGGDIGPDLTQLGTRFSNKDILDAIINPSKAVSDQYASTVFVMKNGQSVVGRLVNEDKVNYSISQNPFAASEIRKIPKKDVTSKRYSQESIMFPGLINSLNPQELRDLMAYLKSGGNQNNEVYKAGGK
ncbi:heme-binding protein [Spirosoma sp.]|uniref:heme-binding protein n=1 Tax=Spirosoma sp. TaxID=1899569 RepID=UPI003B3ADF8C